MLNTRKQSQKTIYCMIQFICIVHFRQIRRDRRQFSGWKELAELEEMGGPASEHRISFWGDENALNLDYGIVHFQQLYFNKVGSFFREKNRKRYPQCLRSHHPLPESTKYCPPNCGKSNLGSYQMFNTKPSTVVICPLPLTKINKYLYSWKVRGEVEGVLYNKGFSH